MALFGAYGKKDEIILTSIFFIEVALTFGLAPFYLPAGCPLSPMQVVMALAACCAILLPMIKAVKFTSGVCAAWFSRTLVKGDPLSKFRARQKFEDQCWQMWIHTTMTALEVYILYFDGGGEPWMRHYPSLWLPCPREQVHRKASVHVLYMVQMAIWIVTAFSHQFMEQRHKDYVLMFVHHLVTIALIGLSYTYGYVRIGVLVLLWHDSSDIVIDLLKTTNYLKLEGLKYGFLVEICFVSNLFTYTRLYCYGYHVVYLGGWLAPREVMLAPDAPGIGWAKEALPTHENITGYWMFNTLMSSLIVMHIIWYALFWRIFYRLLTKESAHDAGREEYEGDSDDD